MSNQDDSQDLSSFGYKQELDRTLGSFSSFAAGFSYISILTGMFQMFYIGFGFGGPAFFWSWPLVFFGQFLVGLCFAELSAHYPLSGSVYQWSKQVGSKAAGWFTGWIYLFCLIVTLAAVALALQTTLPQISPSFQFIGDINNPLDSAKNAVLLGCCLIIFTTIVNSIGVGLLATLNNIGVFAELIGVTLLILLFTFYFQRGPEVVFDTLGKEAGGSYIGPFLAAALTSSYVLFGYDTAGSLAEETNEPRKKVPWAIIQALSAAGMMGAFVMLFALMAVKDINAPEIALASGGLPYIVKNVLGETLGNIFLWDVIMAIFACGLAVQTGTVRLIFAMARDNTLPFSKVLSHVSGTSKTPVVPAIVTGFLAILILVLNVNIPKIISLVTSMAILWANMAYLCVTVSLLLMRLKGWPQKGGSGIKEIFSLGKWGLPVNITAVIFGVLIVINLAWPRADVFGTDWYQLYAPPLFTGILLGVGGIYYSFIQKRKTGVIAEHVPTPEVEAGENGISET
jgi:urea carboxylase system permease